MTSFRRQIGFTTTLGLSTLILAGSAFAQMSPANASVPPASDQAAAIKSDPQTSASADNTVYATGKPLDTNQSKEGFWGHVNPFARKKWVNRQVEPVKDQVNELDQLQAKNANDIKDVDRRAKAGIDNAMLAANTADTHAQDAANRANAAQATANGASSKTDSLNGTVSNLDQYQAVTSTAVKFAPGHTILGTQGKSDLDEMAAKLANEKGYIIEVQGYSKSGVQTSQAMADSVVRYLVTEHQVPLYRIYRTGLGKNTATPADGETAIVNGVKVTLLHNSLASMSASAQTSSIPMGAANQSMPQAK